MADREDYGIKFVIGRDTGGAEGLIQAGYFENPRPTDDFENRGKAGQLSYPSPELLEGEFSIVDLETTGFSPNKDVIIEIAAVNVGPGFQVLSEYSTLVKVTQRIPHNIVELTGITQAQVDKLGLPLLDAMTGFTKHVADRPLFAHNASFDLGFLSKAVEACRTPFNNLMHDSLMLARAAWPGLPSYKLSVLAEHFGFGQLPTHRALDDVKTTLELLRAIHETFSGARPWTPPAASTPSSMKPHGIARVGNAEGALFGEVVVFTGELSMSREHAAELSAQAGCTVSANVTKKTTMLVVGTQDLSLLAGHQKSSKHRKAEELIAAGRSIRILAESEFMTLVQNHD